MFKKSLKYLIIIFVNLILLTIFLTIWTDELELQFNDLVRPIEFLKLIGITILGLAILGNVSSVFRKLKINSVKRKIRISTILILLISSYFYVDYSMKIYTNRFTNGEVRNGIMKKISPVENGLGMGTKGENLTEKEYSEITKISWFQKAPKNAENISYEYDYEAFLPDYSFSLSYDLPKETKVDILNYVNDSFSKKRSFEIIENKIRVTYHELRM